MTRAFIAALASFALVAAPVAAQTITLSNSRDNLARVSGQPTAKSLKEWWRIFMSLPSAVPPVADATEPELGKTLDKIPADVPSNFKRADYLETGWPSPPVSNDDGVGAFRLICTAGQVIRDDPIVFPGQPGKSHLHQFFGNTLANGKSTYASLRSSGESTCGGMLNRSAYWIPAMLDGKGKVVRPDFVSIYYKGLNPDNPLCGKSEKSVAKACVPLPRGLRFIFGYDMVSNTQPTGSAHYDCQGKTATSGFYRLIADVAPNCGPNNQLGVTLSAPNCWDGEHLDSPNHRDHMAYTTYGNWGYPKCPDTHPYAVPTFTLGAWYSTGDVPGSVAAWRLSSDDMNMNGQIMKMPAGSTIHADWFDGWDRPTMDTLMANCINAVKSCSGGDLGNGTALKRTLPFSWTAEPRLVDIPPS